MRIRLKGINWIKGTLADGSVREYPYLGRGRGAFRLEGGRGGLEEIGRLIASYNRAKAEGRQPDSTTFKSIVTAFMLSPAFTKQLRPRTKAAYMRIIRLIEDKFGDLPLAALDDPKVSTDFLAWRDSMAATPCQADFAWRVLMRIISWGRGRAMTNYRPPERVEALYYSDRSDLIWEDDHVAAFNAAAPKPLQWALMMAAETGLRQGDLVALPWSAYDPAPTLDSALGWISWTPSKSITKRRPRGRKVRIPVTRRLRALLDGLWADRGQRVLIHKDRNDPILVNSNGRPWKNGATLSTRFGNARNKVPTLEGLHFHDLRGTAVTRLSEAGASPQMVASITGHSIDSVQKIIDRYCAKTDRLAAGAISLLEKARG
jgi:integrase